MEAKAQEIMELVQEVNTIFTGGRVGSSGAEREAKLKELAAAHDAFFELKANLTEGTKVCE